MDLEKIQPPPSGPNLITHQHEIIDDRQVVFIAGETNPVYPMVSELLLREYPEGKRVVMDMTQARMLERWFSGRLSGYHMSLVMICANACPYIKQCPLKNVGLDIPVGAPCPWEVGLFKARVTALCEELNVTSTTKDQYVDYNTIRDVASTEMLLERVSMEIAKDPISIKPEPVGIDGQGVAIYRDEINKKYEWLNQLNRKKVQLLESLSATRRERIKAGVATGQDPSSYVSELMRKKVRIIEMRVSNQIPRTKQKPKLPEPKDVIAFEISDDEMNQEPDKES